MNASRNVASIQDNATAASKPGAPVRRSPIGVQEALDLWEPKRDPKRYQHIEPIAA